MSNGVQLDFTTKETAARMSEEIERQSKQRQTPLTPKSNPEAEPPQGASPYDKDKKISPFGILNKDLQKALNNWEILTEEMTQKISPEEEQLKDVKRLLGELKAKLAEFGD